MVERNLKIKSESRLVGHSTRQSVSKPESRLNGLSRQQSVGRSVSKPYSLLVRPLTSGSVSPSFMQSLMQSVSQ